MPQTGKHVRARVGLYAGEAVKENDELFGKNVILASGVARQAKGGEILVSSLLRSPTRRTDASIFSEPREGGP